MTWGGTVSLSGHVAGPGVNGTTVALQEAPFPFAAGFTQVATARVNARGDFRFSSRPLAIGTRYRAVTLTNLSVTSGTIEARVRAQVGIRRTSRTRRTLRLAGGVQPGAPRRHRHAAAPHPPRRLGARQAQAAEGDRREHSRYRFLVFKQRRARSYRVKIAARDGGAHLGDSSAVRTVGRRR